MPMRCVGPGNICTLLALVCSCAATVPAAAQPAPASPVSSIRVTGDARLTAKPDRVQIDIGVTTRAEQAQQAAAENARQTEAVQSALRKAAGAGAVLKTASYSLSPVYKYRASEEPTLTGYNAANIVQVTLDDLARIGAVIDASTQAGANQVQGIQFTLRDQEALRSQALKEAAVSARGKA